MAIKLLTFDLDHTLWDTDPVMIAAEQAMLDWIAEHSPQTLSIYNAATLREYKDQIATSYPELKAKVTALRIEVLYRVFLQTGYNSDKAREFAQSAFDAFYQARSQLTLYPGVSQVMEALKQQYKIIAVTNGNADLALAGFDHFFDHLINADLIGVAKPAPDMFYAALEKAGVSVEEAIHIGDHPEQDIWAAKQIGMKTIWFNNKKKDWPLESTAPDATYSHWDEFLEILKALS